MLTVILRFAILGSFVGGGVFLVVRDLASAISFPNMSVIAFAPIEALVAAVLASFLSVTFGSFPAAAAGALYWFTLDRYTKRNPRPMFRFVLGGGVGLLTSTSFGLLFSFGDAPSAYTPATNLLSWAFAGAIGGGLSALAIRNATYAFVFGRQVISDGA